MNNEIKNNEVEKKEEIENKKVIKKSTILKYIIYGFLFILCIVLKNITGASNFILGDFGSIVPLLLQTVALMGLKWVPIFCIGGVILTVFEDRFKDFANNFLTVVIIVAITSIGLLLFL